MKKMRGLCNDSVYNNASRAYFSDAESEYGKQTVIQYQGIPLLVEMDENHDYRVIQMMSKIHPII